MTLSLSTVKRFLGVVLFVVLAIASGIAVVSTIQIPNPASAQVVE